MGQHLRDEIVKMAKANAESEARLRAGRGELDSAATGLLDGDVILHLRVLAAIDEADMGPRQRTVFFAFHPAPVDPRHPLAPLRAPETVVMHVFSAEPAPTSSAHTHH